jgi:hypothetical protein
MAFEYSKWIWARRVSTWKQSRDGSVGIAKDWTAGVRFLYSIVSRADSGPPSLLYGGLFSPKVTRPGHEDDDSLLPSAGINNLSPPRGF